MTGRNPKPASLKFRLEDNTLFGTNPADGIDYKIGWCGNGAYSHYVLEEVKDQGWAWYVYADENDPLYRAVRDAEMRMVYKAVKCED